MPFTLQPTASPFPFFTVAENCLVVLTGTPALVGLTVTLTGGAAVTLTLIAPLVVPPSPVFVTVTCTFVPTCDARAVPLTFALVDELTIGVS